MGRIRWYKRDPDAALNGMMILTLEERGAYNTVLDLIYSRDGSVPDDDRFLSGWMRCDMRVWKRIRHRLLDLGKLVIKEGTLTNSRADREVLTALSRVLSAQDAGRASAAKRQSLLNGTNGLASTIVQRDLQLSTTTSTVREERVPPFVPPSGGDTRKANGHARRERATRIPPDWQPSPEDRSFAQDHELDPDATAAEFRDYWCGVPGSKGTKLDWSATFRNQCRRVAGRSRAVQRTGPATGIAKGFADALRLWPNESNEDCGPDQPPPSPLLGRQRR